MQDLELDTPQGLICCKYSQIKSNKYNVKKSFNEFRDCEMLNKENTECFLYNR